MTIVYHPRRVRTRIGACEAAAVGRICYPSNIVFSRIGHIRIGSRVRIIWRMFVRGLYNVAGLDSPYHETEYGPNWS
jgi:hypothetical protein